MNCIVYGQPRSGTSMMMRILMFGGIDVEYKETLSQSMNKEKFRNIHGFFEIDKPSFTKCFKCVSYMHLINVPVETKIIFIQRDLEQHIKSWNRTYSKIDHRERVTRVRKLFEDSLKGRPFIKIKYEDVHENPLRECKKIQEFLGDGFDAEKAALAVDSSLFIKR